MPILPKLTIMICTLEERILQVVSKILSQREDVCYLISWHIREDFEINDIDLSLFMERNDIEVIHYHGESLSGNRNNALAAWKTEFGLIADDDETFTNEGFDIIIDSFESNPEADLLCFEIQDANGRLHRRYTDYSFDYPCRPNGTYYNSLEIALRKNSFLPRFDERFGLGSPYLACGEEEVFIHQAFKNHLIVRFIPKIIAIVPFGGTGSKYATNKRVRRSKGAVLRVIYGRWGGFARILKQAFLPPTFVSFKYLYDMCCGFRYIEITETNFLLSK